MKFRKGYLVIIFLFTSLFFIFSTYVSAFSVLDALKGIGEAIFGDDKNIKDKKFTIESSITLAPDGDFNNNGEIDAGDSVTFTYTLTNTTDKEYSFATLNTNINRKSINFIHNITGTPSLNDDGETVTIPNFRISANQVATVTFDARINYFTEEDPAITTEAEFMSQEKSSIGKSIKKEIKAKRINKDKIPGAIKQKIGKEGNP